MNNTLKRLLSFALAVVMVMSYGVMPVAAEDSVEGEGTVTCAKAAGCEAQTHDAECPEYVAPCAHTNTTETVVDATCGADGSKTVVCACGVTLSTETIPATGEHVYDETTGLCICGAEKPAQTDLTDEDEGEDEGDETPDAPDAHTCDFSEEVSNTATCTEAGVKTMKCACGKTQEVESPAKGHAYGDGTVTTEPTCAASGVLTKVCGNCEDTITEIIPATGNHNYVEGVCTGCTALEPVVCDSSENCPATENHAEDCLKAIAEAEAKAAADQAKVDEVNALIDALPETVTTENYNDVMAQLSVIMAKQAEMGELWNQINLEKLNAVIEGTYNPEPSDDGLINTKEDLKEAIEEAQDGSTIKLDADIDYGTDHLEIAKPITLNLGGHTLTTHARNYGIALKNANAAVTNGKLNHAGTVAAIKVWNAKEISDLEIDVTGTSSSGNTIDGIVVQEGTNVHIDSIKNVKIYSTSGQGVDSGIKTYNCGNASSPVIGTMDTVTVNAESVGLNISAPCGTATNCSISGGKSGIELWIKGTYSATLNLENCTVNGGVFAHDEFSSNPDIVNNGTLKLTVSGGTGVAEDNIALTIARAEKVEGILKTAMDNAVAKADGTYYASLAKAVSAAPSGATITILKPDDYTLPEFANKELTFVGLDKENTSITDYVATGSQSVSGSTVHFENLTVNGINETYHGLFHTAEVTYKNCVINSMRFLYANEVSFENCVFNSNGAEHSFWTYGASKVTVTGCTFNYTDRAVNCYKETTPGFSTEISFTGCKFNYIGNADAPAGAVEINSSLIDGITVRLSSCTAPEKGELWFIPQWDNLEGKKTTVFEDGELVWPAYAVIVYDSEGKYKSGHDTLALAVSAAQNGDIITIKNAGTYEFPSIANKNVTITGAEDGVEFDMGGNDIGINGSSLTFNNVTFNWDADGWPYHGLAHCVEMVYNGCTFNGTVFLYGNSETFTDCEFNVTGDTYNVWTYGADTVNFTGCTFTSDGKSVLVFHQSDGSHVSFVECTLNANSPVNNKAAIEIDSTFTSSNGIPSNNQANVVIIDAATKANGFDTGKYSGSSLWHDKNNVRNDYVSVYVAGTQVWPIYPVNVTVGNSDPEGFLTLEDALNYARTLTGNVTVTLNEDVAATDPAAIPAGTTINANGHVLIGGFHTEGTGNATIKNIGDNKLGFVLMNSDYHATVTEQEIFIHPGYNGARKYSNPVIYYIDGEPYTAFIEQDGINVVLPMQADHCEDIVLVVENIGIDKVDYEIFEGAKTIFQYGLLHIYDATSAQYHSETWRKDSKVDLLFKGNGFFSGVTGMKITEKDTGKTYATDPHKISKYVSLDFGCTALTLEHEYLQTMPNGEYVITINYADGGAHTSNLKIIKAASSSKADETNPKTGDFIMMPMAIMTLSAAALAVLLIGKKKHA